MIVSRYMRSCGTPACLFAQAERFARFLAPIDLRSCAFYVIAPPIDPEVYSPGAGTCGYTMRHADLVFHDLLKLQGRWCGRGFAVAVTVTQRDQFFGTILHELGHCLVRRGLDREWQLNRADLGETNVLHEFFLENHTAPKDDEDNGRPLWDGHELEFVRAMIHLHHRAALLGFAVHDWEIHAAGPDYGLSSAAKYCCALGDEPLAWIASGRPLQDLATIPPPQAFQDLWSADTANWKPSITPPAAAAS